MQWPNNIKFCWFVCLGFSRFPPTVAPVGETASLPQHNTSVRQVGCGTIQHVSAAAVICHSLPMTQAPAPLAAHRGPLNRCTTPSLWHASVSAARQCGCLRLCVILRAGRSVSRCSSSQGPGLPHADAAPEPQRKQETHREGKRVRGSVSLNDAWPSLRLPVGNR